MRCRDTLWLFCLAFFSCLPNAFAALTVSLTGTVNEGSINGISIDGEAFTVTASLLDGTDVNANPDVGLFALTQATFNAGTNVFVFDASNLWFAQTANPTTDVFAVGFFAGFSPSVPFYESTFSYGDRNSDFPFSTANSNTFQALSWSTFDLGVTTRTGDIIGTATFTNGSNTLQLSSLSPIGASVVTSVPEPSTLSLAMAAAIAVVFRRRTNRFLFSR